MKASRRIQRGGFTMLELLITISVIGVLIALLLPAILSARSASDAIVCRNNFRQFGVGLQQYMTAFGRAPRTKTVHGTSFVALLPYMDQKNVYGLITGEGENLRSSDFHQPEFFVCPQDSVTSSRKLSTNIAENVGICAAGQERRGSGKTHDGVILRFDDPGQVTPASVRDGLSNTSAYAEMIAYPRPDRSRLIYMHARDGVRCGAAAGIQEWCHSAEIGIPAWSFRRGSDWIRSMAQVNHYMHVMRPNEKDCLFTPGAASMHRDGVHTVLCDGSVRFVSSSIDSGVWQAAGSRAGSDGPVEW
jgi:prepilin-type N-terminal cleavage/methylation domain-containing protein